ncbi:hypothetical protein KAW50_02365 [candidate division WOR-3 bacterium]|nr:hypothetical protein [candidate division WOR-3 bacterium]
MEPTYLQRLSFIKYLFSIIGLYQSYQPEPLYGVSILSFHDSVELFLQLSLEKLNITKASQSFMDYWEIIKSEKGMTLSQKGSMKRLNKARVGLKHSGIIPSKLDIESFRATTLAFFNENCLKIFDRDFDDISLIDIIKFERSKKLLKQAKSDFENNSIEKSLQNIALSFEYLISDYEKSKGVGLFHRSPFPFSKHITRRYKEIDEVVKSIEANTKAIKILSFGIDYKKYVKYKSIVPSVRLTMNGTPSLDPSRKIVLSKEDLDFCINFIVESALKLQEFDFELENRMKFKFKPLI